MWKELSAEEKAKYSYKENKTENVVNQKEQSDEGNEEKTQRLEAQAE
jgi:hypothetical protein